MTSDTNAVLILNELIARASPMNVDSDVGVGRTGGTGEAKLHGDSVSLEELRRILRPWLRMPEPPDTVVLGCTHFLYYGVSFASCPKGRG
ncbi:hypothetical protein KCP77_00290 [Salmonella enterica subsp. enterica]|nr:hypothetical protein KCP77_00290 [Salmonella enterica subsp. enterica]